MIKFQKPVIKIKALWRFPSLSTHVLQCKRFHLAATVEFAKLLREYFKGGIR